MTKRTRELIEKDRFSLLNENEKFIIDKRIVQDLKDKVLNRNIECKIDEVEDEDWVVVHIKVGI